MNDDELELELIEILAGLERESYAAQARACMDAVRLHDRISEDQADKKTSEGEHNG